MQEGKIKKAIWIIIVLLILAAGSFAAYLLLKAKNKPEDIPITKKETTEKKSTKITFDKESMTIDPFSDKNGPFYHSVYKATSSDGLAFVRENEVLIEKASVPDAVKMPDGRIIIYAVDGAQRSFSGFVIALSKDNGKTWEKGSLQLKTTRKGALGADPQAVLLEDGKVRLYYIVFPDKKPPLDETGKPIPTGEKMKVMTAISDDGVIFTEESGSVYETAEILTDPDVVKIGDKWFMYLSLGSENIAFSSNDGKDFEKEKTIRKDGAISKTVKFGEGKYRQFFCKNGISSAVTTEGLSWEDDAGSRLEAEKAEIICDPTPVKLDDGSWLMFFKSQKVDPNIMKEKE